MSRLTRRSRLLISTLLPLAVVCLALHVAEVARSGLAQLPVWAVRDPDGGYPRVGGYRVETDSSGSGLLPGDRLIRVGDADLRGAGFLGFDAIALAETGALGTAPLVFERDGVRREGTIRPRSRPYPWSRVPPLVLGFAVALLVLLRAPASPDAQRFYAAFVSYGLVEAQFYGGPEWKTWASLLLWNLGLPVAVLLVLRWATWFPAEVGRSARPWWAWAWLGALVWVPLRLSYLYGGPIPSHLLPAASQAAHGSLMIGTIVLLLRNYAHADPVGRLRLKWVLWGAAVGSAPLVAAQLALLAWPDWDGFRATFALGVGWTSIALLCLLVAIVRYNAFDIDRLLSATASYTLVGAVFLGGLLVGLPELADSVARRAGVGEGPARAALAIALAGALLVAHRRLRPELDRVFFPERLERERGVERLLRDLSQCRSRDEVLELVAERLHGVLRPERCVAHAVEGARLAPHTALGDGKAPGFPADGPLALALERDPRPLRVADPAFARAVPDLAAEERTALEALGAAVLLPLRCGKDLAGVVALGPRRSGDVYTRTDLTLLDAVAQKASAVLLHLRDAETIRSERGRARDLARLRAEAERALEQRSHFLAAASHDLRQPLHAVRMYASLLAERGRLGDSERDLVERLERSAASLAEMFSSLLDVSRLDVGAIEARLADFALDPLLDDLCAEAAPAAAAKGLALRRSACELSVRSDPVLLGRILRNLLANAIRYTDAGEARVAARVDGERVWISVSDTGPGIPPERHQEIFREFVRLDPDAEQRGLGLGLAIVERLAAVLGHELALQSEPGRGSTFALAVPLAARAVREVEAPSAAGLAGRRVVLVDDDLAVLASTRAVLEGWGCRVVAARSAEEALETVRLHGLRPDAILADHRLRAGATGLEAIERIRAALGEAIPAAVLSGETATATVEQVRARGLPLLAKPAAPARLRALLAELLRR